METFRKILLGLLGFSVVAGIGLALWLGPRAFREFKAIQAKPSLQLFQHVEGVAHPLPDGRVLLAGRQGPQGSMNAEIYDPVANQFLQTGNMRYPRNFNFVSTSLSDGRVIVAGGAIGDPGSESIEVYDPTKKSWQEIGRLPKDCRPSDAVALRDDSILFITGEGGKEGLLRFTPSSRLIKAEGPQQMVVNGTPLGTLLADGKVLITHLEYGEGEEPNAFLYDAAEHEAKPLPRMAQNRSQHQATMMSDGRVLITGGTDSEPSAEIFDPRTCTFSPTGPMVAPRSLHRSVTLPDRRILLIGGVRSQRYSWHLDAGSIENKSPEELVKLLDEKRKSSPLSKPLEAEIEIYDPLSNRFFAIQPPPSNISSGAGNRGGLHLSMPNGEILFLSSHGPLFFTPSTNSWRFPVPR